MPRASGRSLDDLRHPEEDDRESSVLDLFGIWVRRTPDATAVESGNCRLTYSELDRAANRVANRLRRLGIDDERRVGVAAHRSIEAIVAFLGVLKSGGAYVPLDPDDPAPRLDFMIDDTSLRVVLAPEAFAGSVRERPVEVVGLGALDGEADDAPPVRVGPRSLAYVMYTSGSTGRPKGVAIDHRCIVQRVRGAHRYMPTRDEGMLQVSELDFDAQTWEIWSALLNGARLVIAEPGRHDPHRLGRLLDEHDVAVALLSPGLFHQMVEGNLAGLGGLRILLAGGDVMSPIHARRFVEAYPGIPLVNLYGPTEVTVCGTAHEVDTLAPGEAVPIGAALGNTSLAVLDENGTAVAPGAKGELYIGGDCVARGYLNLPGPTADRFVPDPSAASPDARMYRTGDLVIVRPDGALDFVGRVDDQVKIRGYRVEPAEVEAHLTGAPGVAQAAVVPREDVPGHLRLVAYVVPTVGYDGPSARAFLEERLPVHMIPSAFVTVTALPLTSRGKVDRNALPAPADGYGGAPTTGTERALARIWCDVLQREEIGVDDDFLELGGDSLLALRVLVRVRADLGVELPVDAIFQEGTIARLARRTEGVAEGTDRQVPCPPIGRIDGRDRVEVSPTQAQACFVSEMAEDAIPYQFNALIHFTGVLDVGALERALTELVRRHEILRTRFPKRRGTWWQVVEPPFTVALPVVDVRESDDPESDLQQVASAAFATRIEIDRLPLLRWTLVRTADERWTLVHSEHHLVHDGWSWSVFLREVAALYRAALEGPEGEVGSLPEPQLQFRDFTRWQRDLIDGDLGREQLQYWTRQLADLPAPLELPTDRPRPPRPTYRGGQLVLALPPTTIERLRTVGREHGATLFMTMLSAFFVLLHRYSGQHELVVGSGVANRRLRETEDLIGMVLNTVALRADLSDDPTVGELLERVRLVTLGAFTNQDLPFERVLEALAPERRAGIAPIYQTLFSFQDPPLPDLSLPGVTATPDDSPGNYAAKADLNVVVINPRPQGAPNPNGDGGVTVIWEYSSDLFDDATATRMLHSYRVLLEALADSSTTRITALPILAESDRQRIVDGAGTTVGYERNASIVDVFEQRVLEAPDAVALLFGDAGRVTYDELNRSANRLARRLIALGVSPGDLVGVFLERSPRMIVALLAVLKAGGAYVPFDTTWPTHRLATLLADTGIEVVCTESRQLSGLPPDCRPLCLDDVDEAELPDHSPNVSVDPTDLAYVTFTSGSTGEPKGVEVPHRAVIRLVRGVDYVELTPRETLLSFAPLAFDASTFEIWGSLLNGSRLALAPAVPQSPTDIGELVRRHGVTTLWLTAGLFNQFVDRNGQDLAQIRQLVAGGDVLSPSHVATALQLLPENGVLVNGYGPTEGTTFTCCHRMPARTRIGDRVPIGRPIANTSVYVLDERGELVPPGVAGELHIGGDGVARGYRGRPDLTAERFVQDGFGSDPHARLYRTGDRVRRRANGVIDFVGRIDNQVKIRGFRVEPEAVERAIADHPAVRDAAVVARTYGPGDKRLVAYVVPVEGSVSFTELRESLAERLPAYEIPAAWVPVTALPITQNGKVDRDALPDPDGERHDDTADSAHVPDALERRMLDIWEAVLQVRPVRLEDDFFDLGGHSLLAVDLFARIEREIGPRLSLAVIFEASTPEQLVNVVRQEGWEAPWASLVPLNARGERPPFFCAAAGDGNTVGYGALSRHLSLDQPFYGLQPRGLDGRALLDTTVEAIARHYVRAVRSVQASGPYLLGGRCLGGLVAYEMARILEAAGEPVALLVILDSIGPRWEPRALPGGVPFDEVMNLARLRAESEGVGFGDIFDEPGASAFLEWLREPVAVAGDAVVNRYLYEAYRARPDVQAAYPVLEGEGVARVVDWGSVSGPREMGMSTVVLPPPTDAAAALRPPRPARTRRVLWSAATRATDWVDVATRGRLRRLAPRRLERLQEIATIAALRYRAGSYRGRVTLLRSEEFAGNVEIARWHGVDAAGVDERFVTGSHRSMLREPDVVALAETLERCIDDVSSSREHAAHGVGHRAEEYRARER